MGKKAKIPRGAVKKENKAKETKLTNYTPEPFFVDYDEKVLAAMVYLSSVSIYVYTMYPGLPGGDSGELMATAKDFGVSHPPGYPTFTTLAALMINLFPFGTTAWKTNFLSTLIAGFANVVMYINVKRFTGSDSMGVLTAGWCGFSRIFWMWSIQGEVFSFSNFFAAMIMYVTWRFSNADGKAGKFYEAKIGTLVCGLALTNQHTSVLYIFPTSLWVLFTLWRYDLAQFNCLFKVGLHGLLGLSPYLQLPISSLFFKARVTWGDHRTFSDFKKHLLREDFGTFRLVSSNEQSTFLDNFMVYFNDSSRELTLAVWLLVLVSFVAVAWKGTYKQREVFTLYALMFSTYHLVFCSLANIKNPKGIFHGVLERFWLQPSIALCTMGGCGLGMLLTYARSKIPNLRFIFLAVAIIITSYQVQRNYYDCNENDNYYFYHFSRNILPHVPRRSIILTSGDFSTNTFRYHTIGEEYRTDVMVMDMQFMQAVWFYIMLMPVNWPDVEFPGVYKAGKDQKYPFYNLKRFLDDNMDKFPDIFMCVNIPDKEDSIEGYYETWPFGMCRKFIKVNSPTTPDPLEYIKTLPFWDLDTTPLPDVERYEPETWEYTLLNSVLESYIKPAVFIWERANAYTGRDDMYDLRYKYYSKALDIHKENRLYLHKYIEQGVLSNKTMTLLSPLEKNIGHLSLILHEMTKDPAQKKYYEKETIKHWTYYTEWYRSEIILKDTLLPTIQSILKAGNLDGIRIKV